MSTGAGSSPLAGSARVVALVLGFLMIAVGCGLPASDGVEVIPKEDHLELLQGTTSTTIAQADPEDEGVALIGLYFIGPDEKLERVIRTFPDGTTLDEVLAALEAGPLAEEIEESGLETLQTQLPVGLSASFGVLDEDRQSQTVKVDPEGQLRVIVEEQPVLGRLIVTQIVCTALGLNFADEVGIEISDGGEEPIVLSDINAETLLRPAYRSDFDDCKTGEQERAEAEDAEAEAEAEADAEGATTTTTTAAVNDSDA